MSEVLVATDVQKSFVDGTNRKIEVLSGVNLKLRNRESLAIVGQSGSGKSTLMHILGGLDKPSGGRVLCGKKEIHRLDPKETSRWRNSSLGFVFQFHHLLFDFTARENVAMPGLIAGRPKNEALGMADAMLEKIGLGHRLNHKVIHLSGGEQQRVAIARALINSPKYILADEPTGNLDAKTGMEMGELMIQACIDHNAALLVVTHNDHFASLIQRRAVLENGRLSQCSAQ